MHPPLTLGWSTSMEKFQYSNILIFWHFMLYLCIACNYICFCSHTVFQHGLEWYSWKPKRKVIRRGTCNPEPEKTLPKVLSSWELHWTIAFPPPSLGSHQNLWNTINHYANIQAKTWFAYLAITIHHIMRRDHPHLTNQERSVSEWIQVNESSERNSILPIWKHHLVT